MKGLEIFVHSVRQVFGNLGPALRISAVLYLVQVAGMVLLGGFDPSGAMFGMQTGQVDWPSLFATLALALVTGLWIAVAWHRYVLRVEQPGAAVPPFHGDRILSYLGNSLLIVLILIPVSIVLGLIVGLLASPFVSSAEPSLAVALVFGLLVYVPVVIIGYRLSVVLPASALGEPLGLGGAWAATQGEAGTILALALVSLVSAFVIDLPATYLLGGIAAQLWTVATQWVVLMVGISILTTLYGHFVEKRPLV